MTALTAPEPIRADLHRWAANTWASLAAMTHPDTGLPADHLDGDLDPASRSGYTSPTNIGGLLWCTVVARELGLIDPADAYARLDRTLTSCAALERDDAGLYANWYDEATGELQRTFDGHPIVPFVSSVDNGWLAAGYAVVSTLVPELADRAGRLLDDMQLQVCYDPAAGLLRGGYWTADPRTVDPDQTSTLADLDGSGLARHHTDHHYGTLDSEPRITSYLGIAAGTIPAEHHDRLPRHRTRYAGTELVITHGGSMFEELMPDLFVPEAAWGPRSWGVNHARAVAAQRHFGLVQAGYGSWGFSPASHPSGGYSEWGATPIGRFGYRSADDSGDGVVTPHALALALPYALGDAHAALSRLATELGAYGPGGFYDAVAVRSGRVARRYLALDQAMVLGALGNLLADDVLRRGLCPDTGPRTGMVDRVRPLLAADDFELPPD